SMARFRREIEEQPDVLSRVIARRAEVEALADAIRGARPRFVSIAARGSSDNAARYAVHLFGRFNGLAVALATPSLHTVHATPPDLSAAVVLGISQSGQSPDVVRVLADARAQGAVTIAFTN